MTAPISNGPTTTRLHHYAGHYCGRWPDWWVVCGLRGLWLRCRWSWSPDRREVRGLQGLAGLRGDTPSEARSVDGERAGRPRAARRSGGVRCAEAWRAAAHRRIEQPQKARRVLAAWTASGRAGLAPHGDLAGCAITLPRPAIARARTPVLSPAACTTLEGSS